MILRRITEHVKAQNWFAVGIDFFIVVIGVFIGIQVSNWNNARADYQREVQYLENLADDIQEEAAALEEVRRALLIRISVIEHMHNDALGEALPRTTKWSAGAESVGLDTVLTIPGPVSLEGFDRDYFLSYAIFARVFSENNSAFLTLQATGDFGIIRDKNLAYKIADYYANIENLKFLENGTVREMRDFASTVARQNGLNPFGFNKYDAVLAFVENDKEFAAALRALRSVSALNFTSADYAHGEAAAILDELQELR